MQKEFWSVRNKICSKSVLPQTNSDALSITCDVEIHYGILKFKLVDDHKNICSINFNLLIKRTGEDSLPIHQVFDCRHGFLVVVKLFQGFSSSDIPEVSACTPNRNKAKAWRIHWNLFNGICMIKAHLRCLVFNIKETNGRLVFTQVYIK